MDQLQSSDDWNAWLIFSATIVSTHLACQAGVIFRVFKAEA